MPDVTKAIVGNDIHNGSTVVNTGGSASRSYSVLDDDALTVPTTGTINTKIDNRFDDVRFYSGDTAD